MDDLGISDAQIDSILGGGGDYVAPETGADTTSAPAPSGNEFKFTANGKEIITDAQKAAQWASQGYNYAQHMQEFKSKQDQFSQRENEFNQRFNTYESIDKQAQNNPDWWNHVLSSYQTRQQNPPPQNLEADPFKHEISALKNELNEIKQFKNDIIAEKQAAKMGEEDKKLSQEIQSIRDEFKDLDWNGFDMNGKSLEMRILEHANTNSINSFRAAFRDFNHDSLVKMYESKGRESLQKEIQRNTKLGLLGETPAPLKKFEEAGVKNKSYDDLFRESLKELGL